MANIGYDKSFAFAVDIIAVAKELQKKHGYEMANQLVRCGTSVGANLSEAEFAQSDADFVSKISIALKEAAESRYWLRLLRETCDVSSEDAARLISQADEIIRILVASLKTAKKQIEIRR